MTLRIRSNGACGPSFGRCLIDGGTRWSVPEEIPVAIIVNGRNYAVMLATPDNLDDFAIGFALSERIVDSLDDLIALHLDKRHDGAEARLDISAGMLERFDIQQRRRTLAGRAGCGLCGLENAETFFQKLPITGTEKLRIDPAAIARAHAQFPGHQTLNRETRSVHGAAFADPDGIILCAREDIGRHNALDKLLGSLVRQMRDPADGFVLLSSRCSYELVEKAARLGVRVLASVSGPTAFAMRKAEEANIAIYCRAGDHFVAIHQLT